MVVDARRRLQLLLVALFGCCVTDAVLTYDGATRGILTEANPLMAGLMGCPVGFFGAKLSLSLLGCVGLRLAAPHRPKEVVLATVALVLCYTVLNAYHIIGLVGSV